MLWFLICPTNPIESFFCFDCGSVSEFKIKETEITYADGAYRDNKNHFNIKSDDEKILPPIDFGQLYLLRDGSTFGNL